MLCLWPNFYESLSWGLYFLQAGMTFVKEVNSLLLSAINMLFHVSLSGNILFSPPLTPFLPLSPGWALVAEPGACN